MVFKIDKCNIYWYLNTSIQMIVHLAAFTECFMPRKKKSTQSNYLCMVWHT